MTKLADLLHSLAAVIICYHDAQVSDKLVNDPDPKLINDHTKKISEILLSDPKTGFAKLNDLITRCTLNYSYRKHLLDYLLNEVIFLKNALDKKEPYASSEFLKYQANMTQMFTNLRQLLLTPKSSNFNVKYSPVEGKEPSITLNGLTDNGVIYTKLCKSGELLEELFLQFNLLRSSSKINFIEKAESICQEHQNSLLNTQLDAQNKVLLEKDLQIEKFTQQLQFLQQGPSEQARQLQQAQERIKEVEMQLDIANVKFNAKATEAAVVKPFWRSSLFVQYNPFPFAHSQPSSDSDYDNVSPRN